jgi:hypothetical protein
MAYFLFQKNLDNLEGTICKIAETLGDLDNLLINKNDYKIIEDNEVNFDKIKLNLLNIIKYNGNQITYFENNPESVGFWRLSYLQNTVENYKKIIKNFTEINPNHPGFNQWNNYYNQINSLDLNSFTFPTTYNLEQYFKNNNKPYFSILQIP